MNYKSRTVVFAMILNQLAVVAFPTISSALPGGPAQPEFQSFQQAGMNQMVDPFTGDFSYNIPLMNVPGPGGGYPINLAYAAGITMDQEASWVGLGWSINPGSISRNVNGIPDDFAGLNIEQEMNLKDDVTFGVNGGVSTVDEILGGEVGVNVGLERGIYYNSYRGYGLSRSFNLGGSYDFGGDNSPDTDNLQATAFLNGSLNADSQSGLGFNYNAGVSFGQECSKSMAWNRKYTLGLNQNIQANSSKRNLGVYSSYKIDALNTQISTNSYDSYYPKITSERKGINTSLSLSLSADIVGVDVGDLSVSGYYNVQKQKEKIQSVPAYGYLYEHLDNNISNRALRDYNIESSISPSKHVPAIAPAYKTHDSYYITGQGISGSIRPFRSDISFSTPQVTKSNSDGGTLGLDFSAGVASGKIGVSADVTTGGSYSGPWRMPDSQIDLELAEINASLTPELILDISSSSNPDMLSPNLFETNFKENYKSRSRTDIYDPRFEPFFFALENEPAYSSISEIENLDPNSINYFPVDKHWVGSSAQPIATDSPGNSDHYRKVRKNRSQFYGTRTISEVWSTSNDEQISITKDNGQTELLKTHLDDLFSNQATDQRIAQMYCVTTDGMRYDYGLPVYNLEEHETVFSVGSGDITDNVMYKVYLPEDISLSNSNGIDNYYFHQKIPAYAHAYLITAIYSPDYVDITGNGPTPDDFGSYTKFNYTRTNDKYGYKSPYARNSTSTADFNPGYLSDYLDDKCNMRSGLKEIYYLNSIETKTHIAKFILNAGGNLVNNNGLIVNGERQDGRGADYLPHYSVDDLDNKTHYLTEIVLYKKVNPFVGAEAGNLEKLQTIHFAYDYSLCKAYECNKNTIEAAASSNAANGFKPIFGSSSSEEISGKLTLRKIWTSYYQSANNEQNVYQFDYLDTDNQPLMQYQNPEFRSYSIDRWGQYSIDNPTTNYLDTRDNPYCNQSTNINNDQESNIDDNNIRNAIASAWCLRKIHTPGGGHIHIEYESDDYLFVQDKQAMQMAKITGLGEDDGSISDAIGNFDLTGNSSTSRTRIYFELNDLNQTYTQQQMIQAFQNQKYLYFKAFMHLRKKNLDNDPSNIMEDAEDYVDGWAKIDVENNIPSCGVAEHMGKHYGYVDVKLESFKEIQLSDNEEAQWQVVHPFRFAGWQYMQANRSDLLYQRLELNESIGIGLFNNLIEMIPQTVSILFGFYKYAKSRGFCSKLATSRNSYIRMKCIDGRKYGGGHRVASITMEDNWNETLVNDEEFITGIEYLYLAEDGKSSSGVASYEPIVGGEENPHREPIEFNGNENSLSLRHKSSFFEYPVCESQMPTPVVGYSRVIKVKHREVANSYRNSEGIEVDHFYTAREFPTMVYHSALDVAPYNVNIPIPFIGNYSFNNNGFSQGFLVQKNNMHGQLKRSETYSYLGQDLRNASDHSHFFEVVSPATYTQYDYKTQAPFNDQVKNKLSGKVDYLDKDGTVSQGYMGTMIEHHLYQEQNSTYSLTSGANAQLNVVTAPITVPTAFPIFRYNEKIFRSMTYMNVVTQTGIVEKITAFNEGQNLTTKNIYYDKVTGNPILSTIENSFGDPVYSYHIPGHFAYEKMGQCYFNEGMILKVKGVFGLDGNEIVGIAGNDLGYLRFKQEMIKDGTSSEDYFCTGDIIQSFPDGEKYWVEDVDEDVGDYAIKIRLKNKHDALADFSNLNVDGYFKVIRSGKLNQLNIEIGSITSLDNPVMTQTALDYLNQVLNSNSNISENSSFEITTQCGEVLIFHFGSSINGYVEIGISNPNNPYQSYTIELFGTSWEDSENHINGPKVLDDLVLMIAGNGNLIGEIPQNGLNNNQTINISTPPSSFDSEIVTEAVCPLAVLNAAAYTYSDDWSHKISLGEALVENWANSDDYDLERFESNPFRYGIKGVPRMLSTYTYQIDRKQIHINDELNKTNIRRDGIYDEFFEFDWNNLTLNNANHWVKKSETALYNPYGFATDELNALGIHTSMISAPDNDIALAVCNNAMAQEIAFQGFEYYGEEMQLTGQSPDYSQFSLYNENATVITLNTDAHSGRYAALLPEETKYRVDFNAGSSVLEPMITVNAMSSSTQANQINSFVPLGKNIRYVLSGWYKVNDEGEIPNVSIKRSALNGLNSIYPQISNSSEANVVSNEVDGWRKFEMEFLGPDQITSTSLGTLIGYFEIQFQNEFIWDDLRIQPFNSSMKSYVYDINLQRLIAEHDERNFSTFYCYDELGALTQIKKETERGIYTVQGQQNHIKQN